LVQNNQTAFAQGNALYTAFNETEFIRKMTDMSQHIPVIYARHMPFVDFENASFFPAMPRIFKMIEKLTSDELKIVLTKLESV